MSGYVRLWLELLRLSWRRQPRLCVVFVGSQVLDIVAFAGIALALRAAIDGAARGMATAAVAGGIGAAIAYASSWVLGGSGSTLRLQLVERVGLTELDADLVRLVNRIEGIEHLERTEFLDRVTVLRGAAWGIMDSAWGAVDTLLGVTRLLVTLVLLGTVDPLLLGLPLFAAVPIWFDHRGNRPVSVAETETAEAMRLQRHLFELSTGAASGKEIRVTGAVGELAQRQAEAWDEVFRRRFRAQVVAAAWRMCGWVLFVLGFLGAVLLVVHRTLSGQGSVGDVVLAITIAASLRFAVQQTVDQATTLAGYRRLLDPFLWLREYAARELSRERGLAPAPPVLHTGIELDAVSYTYAHTGQPAVDAVSVRLPAGAVVAVVGEYGSGKTTLVKLLAKFYRPDAGTIRVDGVDLQDLDTAAWRGRISSAFQDFGRYEATLRECVGLGDLDAIDDRARVAAALEAAGAAALVVSLPQGVDSQLGKEFGGTELSEGQWQKSALARACMRRSPLLFVLDEPTASLDAPSEHAIFTHYMRHARALSASTGAVTVIVSHRFSTVAGADVILVLERGRLVEAGSHTELLASGGTYAQLYSIQAVAYAPTAGEPEPAPAGGVRPARRSG